MRTFRTLVFGLASLMPILCHAQAKCPWLNEATAGGILGGAVTLTANVNPQGDGSCEFSHQQGSVIHALRISVETMTDIPGQFPAHLAQCVSKSTPLRTIGNETVECSADDQSGQYAEQVVGRVRDHAFAILLSTSSSSDRSMTPEMRRERAHLAAEQVSGILF